MKKNLFKIIFLAICLKSFSQIMEVKSHVDWTKNLFTSDIYLDVNKANISMPAGKSIATSIISTKKPVLIKPFILTLFVDNTESLDDSVLSQNITLKQITEIIESGKQSANTFSLDGKTISTQNKINLNDIASLMTKHKNAYSPEESLETVPSKKFSGIIIDARGVYPVHGEYVKSAVYPSFFPKIWDDEMSLIYEKNFCEKDLIHLQGMVQFHYSNDLSEYENRIGNVPLYIKAKKVFGRNRTDPVISKKDALKILSVPENIELLKQGKVIVLLDKENLVYDLKVPEKNNDYYTLYREIKKYYFDNKIDIEISDGPAGIVFSVNLKFIPDSPVLLPEEQPRIEKIARTLSEIIKNNEFTILVEGHTADVGKPVGQMNLSIERTRTVMNALINEGIPKELFTYKGYGGTKPVATNATEEGRAQNRRVDITARPRATYIQRDW